MPDRSKLTLSDSKLDLPASPSEVTHNKCTKTKSTASSIPDLPKNGAPIGSRLKSEEAQEAALHNELNGIRGINQVIEGVIDSLERAKGNMEVCTFLA